MDTLDQLVSFILRRSQTIVFGNVVRHPKALYKALEAVPMLQVAIVSKHYLFPTSRDNRIRIVNKTDDRCDLLILLEPSPYKLLDKPPTASRMVVFTSHLNFKTNPESVFTYISYFHFESSRVQLVRDIKRLLEIQDASVQTTNASAIETGAVNVMNVKGRMDGDVLEVSTYVVIDLSLHQTSSFGMYLAFLDAFEFLLLNVDKVSNWLISFPEKHGRQAFDQFVQETLDNLYCLKFENGNVTDLKNILALLPFYNSGIIDRKYNIKTFNFAGVEYVAPDTMQDACKAAAMYNLEHWVKSVYRLK